MEEVAKYLFVATAAVAFFTFLTISTWIETRAAERTARERLSLLKKVVDQPAPVAELIRDLLREEDARAQQVAREKKRETRQEGLKGGVVVVGTGVGLSVFLYSIIPDKPIWTVGVLVMLIGVVTSVFAYFEQVDG
jgi:uncharacterized protein DUF6249